MDSLLMDLEDTDNVFDDINYDLNNVPSYLDDLKKLEKEMEETDALFKGSRVTEN
ncbi:MAG: hypothetical protein LAT84_09660 [Balneolia bacterium]|nr:hypothetical protein [Balneolia bacterium]